MVNHCIYTLTLVDIATDWLKEPQMKLKDESFTQYMVLQTGLQTQHGTTVKVLHSNHGGEFLSNEFTAYLECISTQRRLTVHNTPEHNGIAERAH